MRIANYMHKIMIFVLSQTIFKKPDIKYLQTNKPNGIIHMDITDLPSEFNIAIYILMYIIIVN